MSSSNFKISTHVLDTSKGLPVSGLKVQLFMFDDKNEWTLVNEGRTINNGRYEHFVEDKTAFVPRTYKLHFIIKEYYDLINTKTLYPFIDINFEISESGHYHIPLLLNPFGYTTYRGS